MQYTDTSSWKSDPTAVSTVFFLCAAVLTAVAGLGYVIHLAW